MKRFVLLTALAQVCCFAADLTGNWVARDPLPDGTERRTYLDLKQEGSRITGHIRATQFYYEITEKMADHSSGRCFRMGLHDTVPNDFVGTLPLAFEGRKPSTGSILPSRKTGRNSRSSRIG